MSDTSMYYDESGETKGPISEGPTITDTANGTPDPASRIKKTPVLLVLLFTFLTAGIYYPCWFLIRRDQINALQSPVKLGKWVLIAAVVAFAISVLSALVSGFFAGLAEAYGEPQYLLIAKQIDSADWWLSLVVFLVMLWQCFLVKAIFGNHFSAQPQTAIRFSGIATFFFQHLYLQYKINRFG